MTTQCFYEVKAKFYCDSSGDSILAPLTGAEFKVGREAASEFGEKTDRKVSDNMTMGMSCLIQGRETTKEIKFIPPGWSANLSEKDFENREPDIYRESENFWYLELGGKKNTIEDTEEIRDELIELATGTWNYIKNSGNFNADKWDLDFLGFLPGKRESRRMCGEYMITQCDISKGKVFEDEIAYGGWPIDDHFPGGFYHKGVPNTDFKTPAPYSIPYRALYSKNVENLYFAGRNISMTHTAMSSIRVMATCTLLGEAVGKAAYLAVKNNTVPHDVYLNKIFELQELLLNEDCFLPSKVRKISPLCENANLTCENVVRNGQDRPHFIYNTNDKNCSYKVNSGEEITYSFNEADISSVHIVFDSDLNRTTLPGGQCERTHITRANQIIGSPQTHLPKTLCKEFKLIGELKGEKTEILHINNNRKRSFHINLNQKFDKLTLIPMDIWSDDKKIPVISFDFK